MSSATLTHNRRRCHALLPWHMCQCSGYTRATPGSSGIMRRYDDAISHPANYCIHFLCFTSTKLLFNRSENNLPTFHTSDHQWWDKLRYVSEQQSVDLNEISKTKTHQPAAGPPAGAHVPDGERGQGRGGQAPFQTRGMRTNSQDPLHHSQFDSQAGCLCKKQN